MDTPWERVRAEVLANPFAVPDPSWNMAVRRFELESPQEGPPLDLTVVRGCRVRPLEALSIPAYLRVVEQYWECGPREPEDYRPGPDGVYPRPDRSRFRGCWQLSVDLSNFYAALRITAWGRVNHAMTRLATAPLIPELRALGFPFLLTGLDELEFFFPSRILALRGLDRVRALLERHGFLVNWGKTWLAPPGGRRWPRLYRHRFAAGLAWLGWGGGLDLSNDVFLYRRPSFHSLLHLPAVQDVFLRRLRQYDPFPGDRALLLLYLAWSPHRPGGRLREYLLGLPGVWGRAAALGVELPGPVGA